MDAGEETINVVVRQGGQAFWMLMRSMSIKSGTSNSVSSELAKYSKDILGQPGAGVTDGQGIDDPNAVRKVSVNNQDLKVFADELEARGVIFEAVENTKADTVDFVFTAANEAKVKDALDSIIAASLSHKEELVAKRQDLLAKAQAEENMYLTPESKNYITDASKRAVKSQEVAQLRNKALTVDRELRDYLKGESLASKTKRMTTDAKDIEAVRGEQVQDKVMAPELTH